ncbi:MAG: V-type ATP synthase subunit D [Clostridiales bacterium]|nr:V-type ATP synthase subunit D [Clostridiales bacterium]
MSAAIPTKGNLIAIKRSLELARQGYDLMDKKRNILVHEMMGLIDRASEVQQQIDVVFREAYASLQMANITLGFCDQIAAAVPVDDSISVRLRSVMGVEIPSITKDESQPQIEYGLAETNSQLDDAYLKFIRVKKLSRTLAELENTIYRLAYAVIKTQKRANALQNIIIPGQTADIKSITEALEEKDREDYARLKVIKDKIHQ